MQEKISKEQFWTTYKALPKELQDAVFSEETAETIFNACADNGVEDERISKIAGYVGNILLGLLPPEQFQPALELDLNLEPKAAENICQIVYGSILEPVRDQLAELYLSKDKKEVKANEEKIEAGIVTEKETRIKEIEIKIKTGINPEEQIKEILREKTATADSKKETKKTAANETTATKSSDSYREPIGG